jgi:chemotaxis response regulator CheB
MICMYHCIVIDNEYSARGRISSFVEEQDSWQVDDQSIEYKDAVNLVIKNQPDVFYGY